MFSAHSRVWEADGAVRASGGAGRRQSADESFSDPPWSRFQSCYAAEETTRLQWRLENASCFGQVKAGVWPNSYKFSLNVLIKCFVNLLLAELFSSNPSCCCWTNRPTTWTWTPVCGWRRSSSRTFSPQRKHVSFGSHIYPIDLSSKVQANPCAHFTLARLPEWRVHQHHPPASAEAEILHGENRAGLVVKNYPEWTEPYVVFMLLNMEGGVLVLILSRLMDDCAFLYLLG